jgi:DNA mismatch endonuclease (patch repair protein)
MGARETPSYRGLLPSSITASRVAKSSSAKRNSKPELLLRRALWARGLRYRIDVGALPGRPDIVLSRARVVVFCDGDFWHGRNLSERLTALASGHNATYWVAKIRTNVERDRQRDIELAGAGWRVIRCWETDVVRDPGAAAEAVLRVVRSELGSRLQGAVRLNAPEMQL